jgi:hypothetical protein
MRLLSPHFPAGRNGAGLLLLRLSAAIDILPTSEILAVEAFRWTAMLFAAVMILGFWTRVTAILWMGVSLVGFGHGVDLVGSGAQVFKAFAILLLGAGAYSMDAVMFGRRTIILQRGRD